jgi:signal transduction histidine kinase
VAGKTDFAPAQRSDVAEIERQRRLFAGYSQFTQFACIVPDPVLALNGNRQIVFANDPALRALSSGGPDEPYGLRPGEALRCENARKNECGCGTSTFCRYCGAVKAIISSLQGSQAVEECLFARAETGDSFLFQVYTYPLQIETERFSIFVLKDVTRERRMTILEHVFFHDIKNTLTALYGWVDLLKDAQPGDSLSEISRTLDQLSAELIDEVNAQEQLVGAEGNRLALQVCTIDSLALLKEIKELYKNHEAAEGRKISISADSVDIPFNSDLSLIKRVLGNMVKNALEATPKGKQVTIGCARGQDEVKLWVHNTAFVAPEIQSQIFKWSFSTKGKNRGLGTYGMRLLSERYLRGKVSFTSTPDGGTTFTAAYPLELTA